MAPEPPPLAIRKRARAPHTCRVLSRVLLPRRRAVLLTVAALVCALVATGVLANRARGAGLTRCERFAPDSVKRARLVTGSGQRVVVIGDSWSAGLGLDHPAQSWP